MLAADADGKLYADKREVFTGALDGNQIWRMQARRDKGFVWWNPKHDCRIRYTDKGELSCAKGAAGAADLYLFVYVSERLPQGADYEEPKVEEKKPQPRTRTLEPKAPAPVDWSKFDWGKAKEEINGLKFKLQDKPNDLNVWIYNKEYLFRRLRVVDVDGDQEALATGLVPPPKDSEEALAQEWHFEKSEKSAGTYNIGSRKCKNCRLNARDDGTVYIEQDPSVPVQDTQWHVEEQVDGMWPHDKKMTYFLKHAKHGCYVVFTT